jgi:hypothetical protein
MQYSERKNPHPRARFHALGQRRVSFQRRCTRREVSDFSLGRARLGRSLPACPKDKRNERGVASNRLLNVA